MPRLRATRPCFIVLAMGTVYLPAPGREPSRSRTQACGPTRRMPHTLRLVAGRGRRAATVIGMALELDLDIDPGRKIELRQGIDGLGRRIQDVEEPLVGADLELLAGLLVHVGRAEHRPPTDRGREQDGAGHAGARPSNRLDDLLDRPVEEPVVVGPETDADLLVDEQRHGFTFPLPSRSSARPRYSAMSVTTPAPTVRPPSRIANHNRL